MSLILTLAFSTLSFSQLCINGEGNIFNETLLISADAAASLGPNDTIVAMASAGCVGSSSTLLPNPAATAIPLTVWHDDDLTPEVDGLLPGEAFRIYAQRPSGTLLPLVFEKRLEPDGVFLAIEAAFDTTLTILLDELVADLAAMEQSFDSLAAVSAARTATLSSLLAAETSRADSLQGLVDAFPDAAEIAALRDGLDLANARVAVLESDLVDARGRVAGLANAFRNFLNRMRQ